MNTHILIPIKDIEEDIITLSIKETSSNSYINHKLNLMNKGKVRILKELLSYKQISLSEEDIEEKAALFAKNNSIYPSAEDDTAYGYREALKDLL